MVLGVSHDEASFLGSSHFLAVCVVVSTCVWVVFFSDRGCPCQGGWVSACSSFASVCEREEEKEPLRKDEENIRFESSRSQSWGMEMMMPLYT